MKNFKKKDPITGLEIKRPGQSDSQIQSENEKKLNLSELLETKQGKAVDI